jgi:nitrite reductase/ring-hydroxylating ferredoxin subunit
MTSNPSGAAVEEGTGPLPYPNGWFAPAFSDELPPGRVLTRAFMGREIVLFRTRAGVAAAVDAHCPHLGAHLGHGGAVEGETLRCPFHGFCFDRAGSCVSTPYGGRPPRGGARTHPLREEHGLLLVHHDASGAAPSWEIPPLDTSRWTHLHHCALTLHGHPQDTTENSVDLGHFSQVHGYTSVDVVKPLAIDGPYLNARYGIERPASLFGLIADRRIEFEIHAHGLGYSRVEVSVPEIGLRAHQFVLATPTAPGEVTVRLAVAIDELERSSTVHPLLAPAPRGLLSSALARGVLGAMAADVRQDERIWRHRVHVRRPMLAEGDGPIGPYRRWARQFYGAAADSGLSAS